MKGKFKLFGLVLLALMVLMSACTSKPVSETSDPDQPVTEDTGERYLPENYKGPALTTEPITLRIVRIQLDPTSEALVQEWNKEFTSYYPNITIEEDIVPFGELVSKIQTEVASGSSADIFYADGPNIKQYAYYDLIIPLNDYLTDEFIADFVPATLAEHSFDGKVYAMPWAQSTVLFYYNTEMAAAAGVSFPESTDPADALTWDETMALWEKLQQNPGGGDTPEVWGLGASEFGSGGPGNYYGDGIWIRSFGDPDAPKDSSAYKTFLAISEDGTSVEGYIYTPEAVKGMEFYQSIYQTKKVSPTASFPSQFINGTAATAFYTDAILGELTNEPPEFVWSATYMPRGEVSFSHGGSLTWAIASKSEHPAEAAAYMAYVSNSENQIRWWNAGHRLPARTSVYEQIDLYQEYPYSMTYSQMINSTYSRPQTPAFGEYLSILEPAIKDIALGGDIHTILERAEKEMIEALAKYR